MDFLLSIPYLPHIAVAIVLLVVYQQVAPRLRMRGPSHGSGMEDFLGKVLGSSYKEGKLNRQIAAYRI